MTFFKRKHHSLGLKNNSPFMGMKGVNDLLSLPAMKLLLGLGCFCYLQDFIHNCSYVWFGDGTYLLADHFAIMND